MNHRLFSGRIKWVNIYLETDLWVCLHSIIIICSKSRGSLILRSSDQLQYKIPNCTEGNRPDPMICSPFLVIKACGTWLTYQSHVLNYPLRYLHMLYVFAFHWYVPHLSSFLVKPTQAGVRLLNRSKSGFSLAYIYAKINLCLAKYAMLIINHNARQLYTNNQFAL